MFGLSLIFVEEEISGNKGNSLLLSPWILKSDEPALILAISLDNEEISMRAAVNSLVNWKNFLAGKVIDPS